MSWQRVINAFFVKMPNGKGEWIDIGICGNCNSIHIPAEEANCCDCINIETYAETKSKFDKLRLEKKVNGT